MALAVCRRQRVTDPDSDRQTPTRAVVRSGGDWAMVMGGCPVGVAHYPAGVMLPRRSVVPDEYINI